MGEKRPGGDDDRAARLGAALRANLKRRKAQARGRDDLSGRDPNRRDTPLGQAAGGDEDLRESSANPPHHGQNPAPDADA